MNKELTAMQMLIEWVEKDLKLLGYEHEKILVRANLLLQKEQEQIEKAFNDYENTNILYGRDYYKSKYGGEDVDR